jgi:hypothetical protein
VLCTKHLVSCVGLELLTCGVDHGVIPFVRKCMRGCVSEEQASASAERRAVLHSACALHMSANTCCTVTAQCQSCDMFLCCLSVPFGLSQPAAGTEERVLCVRPSELVLVVRVCLLPKQTHHTCACTYTLPQLSDCRLFV